VIVGARLEGTLDDWRGVDAALGMLVGISSNSRSSLGALRLGAERWSRTRFFGAEASAFGFLMVNLPLLGIPLIMSDIESLPPPVLTRAHTFVISYKQWRVKITLHQTIEKTQLQT
jgi:hypothetical protein